MLTNLNVKRRGNTQKHPAKDGKKICNDCEKEKNVDEFPKDHASPDNRKGICRACFNDRRKELLERRKEGMI